MRRQGCGAEVSGQESLLELATVPLFLACGL